MRLASCFHWTAQYDRVCIHGMRSPDRCPALLTGISRNPAEPTGDAPAPPRVRGAKAEQTPEGPEFHGGVTTRRRSVSCCVHQPLGRARLHLLSKIGSTTLRSSDPGNYTYDLCHRRFALP